MYRKIMFTALVAGAACSLSLSLAFAVTAQPHIEMSIPSGLGADGGQSSLRHLPKFNDDADRTRGEFTVPSWRRVSN